ncbi:hypothetical protein N0V90_005408 [Kalmusia sp. IMI 367209]|nr:hypothetical protein N0V90_005408 [Kalmusia sp. IMI 367209]
MYLSRVIASLVSITSLTSLAVADLRITADNHSFGGVNFPQLQFLEPSYRDEVIRAIVKTNARVIRLFSKTHKKFSVALFIKKLRRKAMERIKRGYSGTLSVCLVLNVLSDADVTQGVDVQNEPWQGIWPIPAGEPWLCDIATHLKDGLGLGDSNIAVITGGISGAQTVDGIQNFPDSAFNCPAIDVIAIHGYFAQDEETAGTPWAKLFLPGDTLVSRALDDKDKPSKLLLVEEWSYLNTDLGLNYKKQAIFDQGNALNYRGIPWIYSHLTFKDEGTSSKVSILRESRFAIGALADVLTRAFRSRSNFNWSKYIPSPPGGLNNLTALPLNPYIPEQSPCTFGCEGYLCDALDGCRTDLLCKNSICQVPSESQPGKAGDICNSKKPCQEHLKCSAGTCQQCKERPTMQADSYPRKIIAYNSIEGQCHPDTTTAFRKDSGPICTLPSPINPRGNPCNNAQHCDANQYCDWGLCKRCTEGCLGMKCRSNNKCKTGVCNVHGRCDYPGKKKILAGPGASARGTTRDRKGPGYNNNAPRGERGPNKVRDEAMRINIPKEEVVATAAATVES